MSGLDDADDASGGTHRSIWLETSEGTDYNRLEGGVHADTVVIGGGIAGLTTAAHLDDAGQSVVVLERDRILTGVTGHTTAKLTSQHGLVYDHLLESVGEEKARQYAEANEAAIDTVESRIDDHGIDCDFERLPAYTYVDSADRQIEVSDEVEAAKRVGLPAAFEESTSLPFDVPAAVRFDDQAQFHPRKYLLALAREVAGDGSHVFENTRATDVRRGDPCRVTTDHGEVAARDVVLATHFPIRDDSFYYARLYPKRSYVLAVRLAEAVPGAMYYGTGEPYFSFRPHPAGDESMALIGGQNHPTGRGGSTTERYRRLERRAHEWFDVESVEYRWSTQDYVSVDGVPFVGKLSPRSDHVYVATGFGGWGMTNGTAAGRILADRILGRESPWSDVFRPTRFNFGASKSDLIRHNRDAMGRFLEDHVRSPPDAGEVDLAPGEAEVLEADGDSVGVYRDEDGEYHVVSAVCTHMGCRVEWNDGEQSWDCPCHGSRFDYDGTVLDTPAVENLEQYDGDDLRFADLDPAR